MADWKPHIARRKVEIGAAAAVIALVGAAFLYAFLDRAVNGESNELWPNPLFLVPLGALVVGLAVIVAMIFVPEKWDQEQTTRDLVQKQILAALERLSPSTTGETGATGPTGPAEDGLSVAQLAGATGATGPAVNAAVHELAEQGKVRLTGSRVSLITTKFDEEGRVAGREILYEDGHQDAEVMPKTAVAIGDVLSPSVTTERTEVPFCTEGPDLKVCIDQEDWQRVDYEALALFVKVSIKNLTDRRQTTSGFRPDSTELLADPDMTTVLRPVERLRDGRELPSGIMRAGEEVTGWVPVIFKHRPRGGTPAYDLIVEDALRNEYRIHVPERPPRKA